MQSSHGGPQRLSRERIKELIAAGPSRIPEGKFSCALGCGKILGRKTDSERHSVSHCPYNKPDSESEGEPIDKRPSCGVCKKRYSRPDAVRRHARKVHGMTREEALAYVII